MNMDHGKNTHNLGMLKTNAPGNNRLGAMAANAMAMAIDRRVICA